ncbi:hypothetical protein [Saccharopolyspora taberi]
MTTHVDLSLLNYAHGGGDCDADKACGTWDFTGLRRTMRGTRWPDILVLCEAERYAFTGGAGAYEAALALRQEQRDLGLRERPYVPLNGTLTQHRGPIAPTVFYDPTTIVVRQWFDGEDADGYERTRNLLKWWPAGAEDGPSNHLIPQHWPWNKPLGRVFDAEELTRYGRPGAPPAVILGDFNTAASGEDVAGWDAINWWQTIRHSQAWAGRPEVYDSLPLDMLLGVWDADQGRRVSAGGHEPGFADVAELVGDTRPTEAAKPPRPPQRNMRFLLNAGFRDRVVDGSYEVHDFLDEDNWDSDHKRVSVTLEVG